jgi:hypothetical protein
MPFGASPRNATIFMVLAPAVGNDGFPPWQVAEVIQLMPQTYEIERSMTPQPGR